MKNQDVAQGARQEITKAQLATIRYLKYSTLHWPHPKNRHALNPNLAHVIAEPTARTIADLGVITGNANIQENGAVTVTTGGETPLGIGGTPAQTDAMTGKTDVRTSGVTTDGMTAESHQEQENLLGRDGQVTSLEGAMTSQENSQEDVMTDQERGLENDQSVHLQDAESVTNAAGMVTWQETAKLTLTLTAVRSTPIALEPRDSAALQSGSRTLQTTLQSTLHPTHLRITTSSSPFLFQHLPRYQVRSQS
jgi:hypothetical protein